MKTGLLLLALLPALAFSAEGDIPIVQSDGTIQTKAVSGDVSIEPDGEAYIYLGKADIYAADIATGAITLNATACDPGDILYRRLTGDTVDVTVGADVARCVLWLDSDDGTHTAGWTAGETVLAPGAYFPALTPPAGAPMRVLVERLPVGVFVSISPPAAQVLP
jgi:hypothetical protein